MSHFSCRVRPVQGSAATSPSTDSASARCASPARASGAIRAIPTRRARRCAACPSSASTSSIRPTATARSSAKTLIREALHPYRGITDRDQGRTHAARPRHLATRRPSRSICAQCVLMSLRRLGVERIDLWQLHRIDPAVPRDEQFDAIAEMQQGRPDPPRRPQRSRRRATSKRRAKYFPVATVQNLYNLVNRKSEAVLDYCDANGIGFIPWFPLAAGELAGAGFAARREIAKRLGATHRRRSRSRGCSSARK